MISSTFLNIFGEGNAAGSPCRRRTANGILQFLCGYVSHERRIRNWRNHRCGAFSKILNACAALVGEQVNYKTLAETAEISQPTAKEW